MKTSQILLLFWLGAAIPTLPAQTSTPGTAPTSSPGETSGMSTQPNPVMQPPQTSPGAGMAPLTSPGAAVTTTNGISGTIKTPPISTPVSPAGQGFVPRTPAGANTRSGRTNQIHRPATTPGVQGSSGGQGSTTPGVQGSSTGQGSTPGVQGSSVPSSTVTPNSANQPTTLPPPR